MSRSQKNVERTTLLERIAQVRAERSEKCDAEKTDMYWPSVAENDARLFEDSSSNEKSIPGVSPDVSSVASKSTVLQQPPGPKLPGRRRLCKALEKDSLPMADELAAAEVIDLPSDSESHISVADDGDGVDDVLCNKLVSLSLAKKQDAPKARTRIMDSFSRSSYGSAASCLESGPSTGEREKDVQFIDSDDGSDDGYTLASDMQTGSSKSRGSGTGNKRSSKLKSSSDDASMVLGEGKLKFALPGKISTYLYAHQREGIQWLWGLHVKRMGGILGDDMGLGKTMQISAFLAGLFHSRQIKRALIVAPKTLIPHWLNELTVAGLGSDVRDYSGTSVSVRETNLQRTFKVGGVLVTTYDIVRHNSKALSGDCYGFDDSDIVTWDYLILDEGHLIKNPTTQRAKSLKEIPSGHRIIISGTPIQNNLREMWALYDFCCPDLLGDRKEFKAKYESLILSGNDKYASDRQKRIGSAVAQELRDRIAPYFLRRMKSEVFPSSGETTKQLAKKNDIIVWLRLSQRQREMHTAFLKSETAHQSLEGSALAALTILKKICDHPLLLTKRATDDVVEGMEALGGADAATVEAMRASITGLVHPDSEDPESRNAQSCKIVFLIALLDNLVKEGHRTLVFAQTLKMLDIIQEELIRRKYCYRRIDGKSKGSDRQKIVEEFQSDNRIAIFLLTSQVGGLGLTLTGADRVVIVDPAWNPSRDNQSVDRAYRIGQMKDVIVYRLMTSGTLEEKIYRKQVFKGGLMKVATEKKEQFRYFSQQELRELLTVPKTGFDISPTQQQLYEEHANQFQVDENLAKHIKFLESQGIVGVSHHDLLFSKAAPDLPPASEDEVASSSGCRMFGSSNMQPSRYKSKAEQPSGVGSAHEPNSEFWKGAQRVNLVELDDNQMNVRRLEDNITRLSSMLSNRADLKAPGWGSKHQEENERP